MRTADVSHTCSGLVVFTSTKSLDACRVLSSSSVWCCPWPGTPLKYWGAAKSGSDQMKASRLCGSPLSVILNVMLHRCTLKCGLSFSDSSVSFATGYFTQTSKIQSLLSALNRQPSKKPSPKVISMCLHGTHNVSQCFPYNSLGDTQTFVYLSGNQILYQRSWSAGSTKGGTQKTFSFIFSWRCVICSTFSYEITSKCLLCMTLVKMWCATGAASKPVQVKAGSQQAEFGTFKEQKHFPGSPAAGVHISGTGVWWEAGVPSYSQSPEQMHPQHKPAWAGLVHCV